MNAQAARRSLPIGVILFTLAYLVAAGVGVVATGNLEFVFYLVVMLVLIAGVLVVHTRVALSRGSLWALSIWGGLHMAGGLVPVPESWPINGETRVMYSLWLIPGWLKFDHVVHAYGFGVATWACFECLRAIETGGDRARPNTFAPTAGRLVLCGAAGLGFGALNEIVEFLAVLLVPETNVGGYFNTGWDLVSNLAGVLIACMLLRIGGRREQTANHAN
jgi:hypothetical protein